MNVDRSQVVKIVATRSFEFNEIKVVVKVEFIGESFESSMVCGVTYDVDVL